MTVKELHVAGYRSIREIRLRLQQLNVLVGPNGCGKTNLYRSMYLVCQASSGDFARELAREGGMPSALWAGKRSKMEDPVLRLAVKLEELEYELSCGRVPISERPNELRFFANDPDIKEEAVKFTHNGKTSTLLSRRGALIDAVNMDGRKVQFPLSLSESESVLSGLREPQKFPELFALRQELQSWRFYHQFRTDLDSPLRQPQVGVLTPVLSHDGHDLGSALATIRGSGNGELLQESINEAFPGAMLILDVEDDCVVIKMQMPHFHRPFELTELSDGTLQYLCLLGALLSPRPPSLLALNEPETSLHTNLLAPLSKLIVLASKSSQIWLTTHSHDLADAIRKQSGALPIELVKINGETKLVSKDDGEED